MRRFLCFTFFILTGFTILSAQQFSPSVVAANGGSAGANGVRLDWTIGEPAIESTTTGENWYTEGFHQPMLLVDKIYSTSNDSYQEDQEGTLDELGDIKVAPNPVSNSLVITIPPNTLQPKHLQLFRQDGATILNRRIELNETTIDLDMSTLAAGMYLLRFVSMDGQALSTFKISKIK